MKSLFQYQHQADGKISLAGFPGVKLAMVEEQGRVRGRDWQTELSLPTYAEEWEQMAEVVGMSNRSVRFILMDQSESRLPGHPRLNPQAVTLPKTCPLEVGHTGFVVGFVHGFITAFDEMRELVPQLYDIEIPDPKPEGDYIVGTARLYDSQLADAAWRGIKQGIFSHMCPMIFAPAESPDMQRLAQVSLACGDYPGCPGARILKTLEG
jgi:hypothetical protein